MTASLDNVLPAVPTPTPARGVASGARAERTVRPPTTNDDLDDALRQSGTADARVRAALLAHARPPRRFARGQYLFHVGSDDPNLYVVESGSVKLYSVTAGGAEQILGFCFPGELFGLDALGVPTHDSSAVALEPTVVRALPAHEIKTLCQHVPAVQQRIHGLLARRINDLHEQMMVLGRMRAEERLAGFLLGLDAHLPTSSRAVHMLWLSMSRYEIGCYLGLALETVSRLLRHFDEKGLIRTRGRRIHLCDLERLYKLAGLSAGGRAATYN